MSEQTCDLPSCSESARYYLWAGAAAHTPQRPSTAEPVPDPNLPAAALKTRTLPVTDQTRYGRATTDPPAHYVERVSLQTREASRDRS